MKTRRAARELTLLAFSRIARDIEKIENINIKDVIVTSVRALAEDAEHNVRNSLDALYKIKEFINDYEFEHPDNIKLPVSAEARPVPIPMTSDMTGRIDELLDAADKTLSALEIAEIASLSGLSEVMEYVERTVKAYLEHKEGIDSQISKFSKGWNIDRIVRIDRDILRIAIVELLYFRDIPVNVSADEAVELAKKYSTEESSSFINGILRQVIEENNIYALKK